MSSDNIAVRVANLSKCYEIYGRPQDRLKQSIYPRLRRLVGQGPKNYYQEFWALKDVSFEVKKGETFGIVGRNGSGKSTLLQIICGTLTPTSGTVETNGRVAAMLELGSGFNPEFTGRENVFMNGVILGLSQEEISARFDDIAAFADIGEFIERPIKTYSSGMVVRLAFAVAINVDPQILVVDEALSVGDERFQRKCFSRIETIKNDGATILFVSHSGAAIVELCDRTMLVDLGEKLAMGVPKLIVGDYLRLLYAPQDRREAIREEIRKEAHNPHLGVGSSAVAAPMQAGIESEPGRETEDEEYHDPSLEPQSTMAYETRGVYIEAPEILTVSGKKVNCVIRGRVYRYIYKVHFDKGATNVRFGMLIKSVSGLELGGGASAPALAQAIPCVPPHTVAHIELRFTAALNPGTYFLNAGVVGTIGSEETYLHRILDAYMFRVLPVSDSTSTGTVYFNIQPEIVFADIGVTQATKIRQ
jgi:homopolymeric O-antigen transport system ATP-binding protein